MKIDFLQEPELEFGVSRHIDIRFGLMNYGPLDYAHPLAPKEIRVGIIGTNETVEGVRNWLEKCRKGIPAKISKQPNLFPKFPGFQPDVGFQSTLIMNDRLQRTINPRIFQDLAKIKKTNQIITESAELFYTELKYLSDNTKPDVLICALPQILLDMTVAPADQFDEIIDEEEDEIEVPLNFHHLMKAKVMDLKVPIQLIVPSTYDETKRRRQKRRAELLRRPQDEATRAWNLHTALYYKANGVPWRLFRKPGEYTTCYVGISFFKTLDGSALLTSVAQVFNERGEGVVVRGGPAKISKHDRQVHLEGKDAAQLLNNALALYKEEHKNFPARVIVHKTSTFQNDEMEGFLTAAQSHRVEFIDLVSVNKSLTRLFRAGLYPSLRGTFLRLSESLSILYTRGSVDFFSTYPGMYVPRPLLIRCERTEQTPKFLAQEILALTKMNWNNTQFDGGDPITIRAARQVGAILKYVPNNSGIASAYRYYM